MTTVTLYSGDNRVSLRAIPDDSIDAVGTDSPYGLIKQVDRFGKPNSKPARSDKNDGSFARLSKGFMGKVWDGTGIERDPEFWAEIYRVLKPGGYVFAFSGSRTGHWQAVAMELAGFIMHPMHGWCFGSGFPKASNAERAIDTRLCDKPGRHYESSLPSDPRPDDHICESCAEGDRWEGWAYGTQAQKPALEPIYLAQKPFSEKTGAANLLKHGVGAVNIDGCRVPTDETIAATRNVAMGSSGSGVFGAADKPGVYQQKPGGRFPSNLILDGSEEVVAMFPDKAGAQAPVFKRNADKFRGTYGAFKGNIDEAGSTFRGDEGSAARFFHQFPLTDEDYHLAIAAGIIGEDVANPLFYHPKAGKADRAGSKHPTVKPVALMQYLIRHITPPGGVVLDPFAGSGTTAEAARREGFDCILMEAEPEYVEFLRQRFPDIHIPSNEEILLSDEELDGNMFSVCSHTARTGINSYSVDLSDLIGSTVDLSDLL